MSFRGEPLVVRAADLRAAVQPFVELADRDRKEEDSLTSRQNRYCSALGANGRLAHWAGVSGRSIWRVLNDDSEHIGLNIADKILQGLNLTHYLHDGTVPVIPNPTWPQATWERSMRQRGVNDPWALVAKEEVA